MLPIRKSVQLSNGAVTLQAWGVDVVDAHLSDLLTLTATLSLMREEWQEFKRGDIGREVWAPFWRLVHASLCRCELPQPLTWHDRLILLEALHELNLLDSAEGKLTALSVRAAQAITRMTQGQMTTSTASSSAPLGQSGMTPSSSGLSA